MLVYIFLLVNLDSLPKVGGVLCSVLIMVYNMRALLGRFERPLFTISSRLQKVKASFHSAITAYEREVRVTDTCFNVNFLNVLNWCEGNDLIFFNTVHSKITVI